MSIKRLNYYNHQFLEEPDFREEQQYHLEMRRRHNRSLHIWGVAEGLEVKKSGNREITVEPGFALDREGRELVVIKPLAWDVGSTERHKQLHVFIGYKEHFEDTDRRIHGGVEGYNRITEFAEVSATHEAEKSGPGVLLAILHFDEEGNIHRVDHSGRQMASSLIAPDGVRTAQLQDGCVTDQKLAPGLRDSLKPEKFKLADGSITMEKLSPDLRSALGVKGWVRLPFKPIRLRPRRAAGGFGEAEPEFSVDVHYAHSDTKGARGTMGIPVPAGATRILEFRIAGLSRGRKIRVQLFRTGWNSQDHKGDYLEILKEEFVHADFDKRFKTERELDEFHALTLDVFAEGEAEIWLVAARFE
jgi:hypothetical protein